MQFVAILVPKFPILLVPVLGTERGPKWVPKVIPKWGPVYKTYIGPNFGLSFGTHSGPVLVPKTRYQEFGKNPSPSDPKFNFGVPRLRWERAAPDAYVRPAGFLSTWMF